MDVNSLLIQLVGLREKLQENPIEIMGKSMVSGFDFTLNQPIEKMTHLNPSFFEARQRMETSRTLGPWDAGGISEVVFG